MHLSQLHTFSVRARVFVDFSKRSKEFDVHGVFYPLWNAILEAAGVSPDTGMPRLQSSYGQNSDESFGPCLVDFLLDDEFTDKQIDAVQAYEREFPGEQRKQQVEQERAVKRIKALAKLFELPVYENVDLTCEEIEDEPSWYE